ncbi:hypothetical protein KEM52_001408, partial [Ascosphaera acerosa]
MRASRDTCLRIMLAALGTAHGLAQSQQVKQPGHPPKTVQPSDDPDVTVWGSIIYTVVGDSDPESWQDRSLTPRGGQQLYDAGTAFANRYLHPPASSNASTAIAGISPYDLVNSQLEIITKNDGPSLASAQAFMQGMYPPRTNQSHGSSSSSSSSSSSGSDGSDGPDAAASYPYAGYQYPKVKFADDQSPLLMQVAAHETCPKLTTAINTYAGSEAYAAQARQSAGLYRALGDSAALAGVFANGSVSYALAQPVYDYQHTF